MKGLNFLDTSLGSYYCSFFRKSRLWLYDIFDLLAELYRGATWNMKLGDFSCPLMMYTEGWGNFKQDFK